MAGTAGLPSMPPGSAERASVALFAALALSALALLAAQQHAPLRRATPPPQTNGGVSRAFARELLQKDTAEAASTPSPSPGPEADCLPCDNDTQCVSVAWQCDGVAQCADGADESPALCTAAFNCTAQGKQECPSPSPSPGGGDTPRAKVCIFPEALCNNARDCPGGADEAPEFCASWTCPPSMSTCPSGVGCFSNASLCDGLQDCQDGSDEASSTCRDFDCASVSKLSCPSPSNSSEPSGQCVWPDLMCNGARDCIGGLDESADACSAFNCSSTGRSTCPSGTGCLYAEQLCDGTPDCLDGSDEGSAFCANYTCAFGIKCPGTNTCVWGAFCDGFSNCAPPNSTDSSGNFSASSAASSAPSPTANGTLPFSADEDPAFCAEYTCPEGYRKCADGVQCISLNSTCNGYSDCADGSDEAPSLCSSYNCTETGRVFCPSGRYCLPDFCSVCSGYAQCPDGSDEWPSSCSLYNATDCAPSGGVDCPPGVFCEAYEAGVGTSAGPVVLSQGAGGVRRRGHGRKHRNSRRRHQRAPHRRHHVKKVLKRSRHGKRGAHA